MILPALTGNILFSSASNHSIIKAKRRFECAECRQKDATRIQNCRKIAKEREAYTVNKILIVEDERKIARFLEKNGGNIIKTIVVKNKLVNLIVK